MMRLDGDEAAANAAITRCMAGLASSLEVTEALLARRPESASSVPDLPRCLEYARLVRAQGLPRCDCPPPQYAESYPSEEDILRRGKRVAFDADVAARLELCLCVFGTFVSIVARDGGVAPGDPLAEAVSEERARHLAHREGERKERVTVLERAIENLRRQIEMQGNSEALQRTLAATEAELAKVNALDAVTICTDRCAF